MLAGSVQEIIARFSSANILVIGDLMLDRFVWGDVSRISPEAPVPVVKVMRETTLLGGAANVAHNIISLGGRCMLAGLTGQDSAGEQLLDLASKAGINSDIIVTDTFQTTVKTRLVARGQQVARVDREDDRRQANIPDRFLSKIARAMDIADAVIVSDYNKGVINKKVMDCLVNHTKKRGIMLLVDPKPDNSSIYHKLSMITPNRKEASALSGIEISNIDNALQAAARISSKFETDNVLVTMGKDGMVLYKKDSDTFTIPTTARDVFDVTGAGDTVIATMGLGAASGLSPRESAILANIAAGIVVGKVGTATVNREELADAASVYFYAAETN